MKKTLFTTLLLAGSLVVAQNGNQGKGQAKKDSDKNKTEVPNGKQQEKGKPEKANAPKGPDNNSKGGKPEQAGKPDKGEKGNPNKPKEANGNRANENKQNGNGNAYGKNKGELSGREFGQQRAAEARAKHQETKPTTIQELEQQRILVRERNTTIVTEIDRKITDARTRLEEMQSAGTITRQVFEEKITALEKIGERKVAVELKLK